jgi:adenylate cyclase
MRFKGRQIDPQQIGRKLGARFLLTGSMRRFARTVKITIHLLDTLNGAQIWSADYKRDLSATDLIALQEAIAREVVGVIADQYGLISRTLSAESGKKAPADLRAYDAILRFYHYEIVLTPQAFDQALEALEQAVSLDPEYGLAWSMLGHLHADNYALGFRPMEDPLTQAMTYAQRGAALAPDNQFALDALTLVYFHRGEKQLFLRYVDQTIALNPNSPYFVGVAGWHLILYGQWQRGLDLISKGMQLNPYHPTWFHLATFIHFYHQERYAEAYGEALKFNCPDLFWDPLVKAVALCRLGQSEEARMAIDDLIRLVPQFAANGRSWIGRYVKVKAVVETLVADLRKAGLVDLA